MSDNTVDHLIHNVLAAAADYDAAERALPDKQRQLHGKARHVLRSDVLQRSLSRLMASQIFCFLKQTPAHEAPS